MRVAVLTLTRDRLDYTKHCFETLEEKAGCGFDHFVLDQGSQDGTPDWLGFDYLPKGLILEPANLGIMPGLNKLLSLVNDQGPYDVIVKFDNDCEILTPFCLRDVAQATVALNALLSPRIMGLMYPPQPTHSTTVGEWKVNHVGGNIGGIFLSAPGNFYDGWNLEVAKDLPTWGLDDVRTCEEARARNMVIGYLDGYEANHYRSTEGQHADYQWYFDRRVSEGGPG